MKCPVCSDVRMREVEKDGVMIDVCPDCKGVWLDRGELEKLMQGLRRYQDEYEHMEQHYYRDKDRSGYDYDGQAGRKPAPGQQNDEHHGYDRGDKYREYDKYGKPKKKKSVFDMLGDIFD